MAKAQVLQQTLAETILTMFKSLQVSLRGELFALKQPLRSPTVFYSFFTTRL